MAAINFNNNGDLSNPNYVSSGGGNPTVFGGTTGNTPNYTLPPPPTTDYNIPPPQEPGLPTNNLSQPNNPAVNMSPWNSMFNPNPTGGAALRVPLGPVSPWESNVTANSLGAGGTPTTFGMNATQFGSQEAQRWLGEHLGMQGYNADPGMMTTYSSPMRMLNQSGNPNSAGMNTGLAADIVSKYGYGPGTYGQYLLDRDKAMLNGQSIADPYANGALGTSGGYGTPQNPFGTVTPNMPQQMAQRITQQNQQLQNRQQQNQQQNIGQNIGQGQQGNQQLNNFFSQIAPIFQLLSSLGIFGNGGGSGNGNIFSGGGFSRRPSLPINTGGYPFFSRFA